jgi:hypothetical protein
MSTAESRKMGLGTVAVKGLWLALDMRFEACMLPGFPQAKCN